MSQRHSFRCAMLFATFVAAPLSAQPPAPEKAPPAERPAVFALSDRSGLPSYLKADGRLLADSRGIHGGEARTFDADFFDKNFTFVVAFELRSMNGQNAEIGLGGSEDGEFVAARLQGSPTVRHAELHIARQKNRPLAKVSRGDHLMCRIEKAGKTLTFAIGSWNDNKFEQSSVQKINAIGKAAPFLNKENAALFLRGTANFTAVRLIVDGKVVDPGTRPMREPTPGYAQMPLVKLGGSAPWPSWLRSVGVPILDKDGISEGVLESIMPKLVDKDFTVDVRFRTVRHDRPTLQVTIAAKEGKIGVGVGTAANRSGNGTSGLVGLRDRGGEELAKVSHPGEYVLRLRRSGDLLTAAIGKIENDALKLLGERTLLSLKQAAPFLADGDAKLRIDIGKSILVEATRLIVDGKETEPVRPAVANAAPDFNRAPLRKLDGSHPLPDWLVSEGIALLDGDGFSEGILHSTDRDLIDKDFTFDMQFRFHDRDQKIFIVGIGGKRGFIHSRVHGPGYGGYGTLALPDVAERHLTEFVTAGPHIFRIEKRGDSLTLAIGDLENGAFAAIGSRTIVDLKKSAPYFDRNNGALRIENDRTVHIDAVRLVVDGKVMGNKAVSDKVVSNKPVAPKRLTVAEKADRPETTGFESAPLLSLGDRNPLPGWLAAGGVAIMDKEGFRDGRLHSIDSSLALKDFVFDVQFRFRDRDRTILLIGVGGPAGSISSRVHGPGYGGYGTVTIPQAEERRLGDFYTAGPHLFRLEKRGDSLTMAIGDIEKGNFEPIASKTIVDLKNVAPFLSKKGNGEVWIQNDKNAAIIEAVRLIVDGKPAEAAPVAKVEPNRAPSVGAKDIAAPPTKTPIEPPTDPALAGRANLLDFKSGKLVPFLRADTDIAFTADGDLDLKNRLFRSVASDFHKKDFTFDVLLRFKEGSHAITRIGIGGLSNDYVDVRFKDSVGSRIHGPGYGGYATVSIDNQEEGRVGQFIAAGQHMFRLQKRGNALTMAMSINFTDKFVPDIETTIADLRSIAPFLNDKNARLFVGADGAVVAVRLVVAGEPIESRDVAFDLPPRIEAEKSLRHQLLKAEDKRPIRLDAPPAGIEIDSKGSLAWTPTKTQAGAHELRFLVGAGKEPLLVRRTITVVSPEDARTVAGDLSRIDSLYRLPLSDAPLSVSVGHDGNSLLLLEGDRLRRVEGDGMHVRETLTLPAKYERLFERADHFVALSDAKKALDILDKKTLRPIRSIAMDYPKRNDLALDPMKPVSYVCVDRGGDEIRDVILIVDEQTGDVFEPERFYGTWAVVAPDGRRLYAGCREVYREGAKLLINPDHVDIIPEFGTFETLMVYDMSKSKPKLMESREGPGGNSSGLKMSPDGKKLTYLSQAGYPVGSGNIPAWDPSNLDKRPVSYPAKANKANPKWLVYHPTLPIVAVATGTGALCFDRNTGALQPERVDLRYPPLDATDAERCWFSPDGQNLLLECKIGATRTLCRLRMNLSPSEREALAAHGKKR